MRAFITVLLAAYATPGMSDPDEDSHYFYTTLPGRYALIGQYPDRGAVYRGTAEIQLKDGRLYLEKKIEETVTLAKGAIERADPGEAEVLRFRWPDHIETCLVRLDLDNYGRLTCNWVKAGTNARQPGLEAYFSTETWP